MKKNHLILSVILIALSTLQSVSSVAQPYTWKQKANFGGVARQSPIGFSIDSLGYIGTGYNGANLNDLWAYNPRTNAWTQKTNAPSGVRSAMSFVVNGKAYVTGGIISGLPFNTTLWMYDPVANTWTTKAPYPGTGIYGGVGFAIGTKGYIGVGNAGTNTGPYLSDFYEYDAVANTWAVKTPFPDTVRFGTYGTSLNGEGYVGLGANENFSGPSEFFNSWWKFDPTSNTWTKMANFIGKSRSSAAGFTINNLLYVGTGNINGQVSDYYQYSDVLNKWTRVANYGGGIRTAAVGFNINNKGYQGTGISSSLSNDFWEYSPDTFQIATSHTDLTCFGNNNGTASVTITGGVKPFTYKWSSGATTASISGIAAATYNVTVTDSVGLSLISANVVVNQPAQLTLGITGNLSICTGGQGTTLTATGANSYVWSAGNGLSTTTGASLAVNPTVTTTYSVVGTSSGACTASASAIVMVGISPTVSASSIGICSGTGGTLTATGTSTSFTWAPALGLSATTGSTVTANPAGTTTYTVTGSNSCGTTSTTVVVTVTPVYTSSFTLPASICGAGTAATINYTGNAPVGAAYSWNFGGGTGGVAGQGPQSITWPSAGTYTVSLSVGSGACTSVVTSHSIVINNIPSSAFTAASPVCTGTASTLTYTGTPITGATYTWNFNGATGGVVGASNQALTWASAGTYTPTLTVSASGCTSSITSVSVIVNSSAKVSVNSLNFCSGTGGLLTASGATTYSWAPALGLSATTGSSVTANPAGTTTYTVTGTSLCGSTTATAVVTVNPLPSVSVNPLTICNGSQGVLIASGAATSFTWSPALGLSATSGVSVTANPTITTTYTVTGTNSCGLTSTTVVVMVNQLPVLNVSPLVICNGSSGLLTASGTSNSYSWSPSIGLSATTGSSVTANPANNTTYTVIGTGGCGSTSATVVVTVNPLPTVNASPLIICNGSGGTLTATGNSASFAWSPSSGLSATTGNSVTASPTTTTTYTVTGSNSCGATSKTVVVTVNPLPTVTVSSATSICNGSSGNLSASGTATSYTWSPSLGLNTTSGANVTANPGANVTYTVTGNNGCGSASATVAVTVNPIPAITCSADSVAKTVTVTTTLDPSNYNFLWNTNPVQTSQTASVNSSGTYSVVVSDVNNCSATCSSVIIIPVQSSCDGNWRTESQDNWGASPCGSRTKCGNSYRYSDCGFYGHERCNYRTYSYRGCSFSVNDYDNQGSCAIGNYLYNNFSAAFPSGYLIVGCSGGNQLKLTSPQAITDFLPSNGSARALSNGTLVNPGRYYSNVFAGQVVALTLSVTFDLYDPNFSSSNTHLQDMVVSSGTFKGWTVQQVLNEANNKLGGCSSKYTVNQLNDVVTSINNNYNNRGCNQHFLKCPNSGRARMEFDGQSDEVGANGMVAAVYPNPFSSTTTIEFENNTDNTHVVVEVYTITGVKVASLFDEETQSGQVYKVAFDGSNLASGMYIYRVTNGSSIVNGKISLIR